MKHVILIALLAASGCVPPGLPGDEEYARFLTDTRCAGCPYLRDYAVGAATRSA